MTDGLNFSLLSLKADAVDKTDVSACYVYLY